MHIEIFKINTQGFILFILSSLAIADLVFDNCRILSLLYHQNIYKSCLPIIVMPRGMREYVIKDGKVYHIVRVDKCRRVVLPKDVIEQVKANAFVVIPSEGKLILEPIEVD